jgi:hypothetical protein
MKPMSPTQEKMLRQLTMRHAHAGTAELMLQTGLTSAMAVDWVLNALHRRGLITFGDEGASVITDAGNAALGINTLTAVRDVRTVTPCVNTDASLNKSGVTKMAKAKIVRTYIIRDTKTKAPKALVESTSGPAALRFYIKGEFTVGYAEQADLREAMKADVPELKDDGSEDATDEAAV